MACFLVNPAMLVAITNTTMVCHAGRELGSGRKLDSTFKDVCAKHKDDVAVELQLSETISVMRVWNDLEHS